MVDKLIKQPNGQTYLSLVKSLYKEKGFRPISKAMTEASRLWKKESKKSFPEIKPEPLA